MLVLLVPLELWGPGASTDVDNIRVDIFHTWSGQGLIRRPQDNRKLKQIMQFSTYPTIYNLMSYNQEYNEQPIYELDFQYSEDSESDTTILQNIYCSYL